MEDRDPAESVEIPIEDSLDLHSFPPREIVQVVVAYLEAAAERGFVEVRLIHGKGKGVQRANVRRLLAGHPQVESFADSGSGLGGWGATVVRLRPVRIGAETERETLNLQTARSCLEHVVGHQPESDEVEVAREVRSDPAPREREA
jgi:hypothetical protein